MCLKEVKNIGRFFLILNKIPMSRQIADVRQIMWFRKLQKLLEIITPYTCLLKKLNLSILDDIY